MDTILNLFSPYEIKARFFPALLVLSPLLFTVIIWYPELIDLESSIFTVSILIITLFFLAKLSREMGVKIQKKLLKEWGEFPSTTLLRHRDTTLDSVTKQRYHGYLKANVVGIKLPTLEEEIENPKFYDVQYNSAIKWLMENTRDPNKYNLLLQDNINYGFSRNMVGIKPIGITFSLISVIVNIFAAYQRYQFVLLDLPLKIWLSFLVSVIFISLWLFFVQSTWIKSTSLAYARTLLATCENIRN